LLRLMVTANAWEGAVNIPIHPKRPTWSNMERSFCNRRFMIIRSPDVDCVIAHIKQIPAI
jgi:hypothetical protein